MTDGPAETMASFMVLIIVECEGVVEYGRSCDVIEVRRLIAEVMCVFWYITFLIGGSGYLPVLLINPSDVARIIQRYEEKTSLLFLIRLCTPLMICSLGNASMRRHLLIIPRVSTFHIF